jgi:hypothetical protein
LRTKFGLGFYAVVNLARHIDRSTDFVRGRAPADKASINLIIEDSVMERGESFPLERVTRGTIDHVAIGIRSAWEDTAVWSTHCPIDDAPWRIRDLAECWERGRKAWLEKERARTQRALSARQRDAKLAAALMRR